jgi:hypothetical protein
MQRVYPLKFLFFCLVWHSREGLITLGAVDSFKWLAKQVNLPEVLQTGLFTNPYPHNETAFISQAALFLLQTG